MKKADIIVTKQNDVDVIKYELKASDVYDDKAADKAASMQCVIPFQYSDEDGRRTITSYVREGMTLEMMFKKTLNKKQVLSIVGGIVSVYEMGTQGIPVSYIVKEPAYVYVNETTYEVKCILIAVKQDVLPLAEIPVFFREIISKMIFDENDKDNYVAKLLSVINAADFSISNLRNYINKEMETIEKPVAQNQVKVNKLGVMNNIQNANRQAPMPPVPQGMPPVQPVQPMQGQMPPAPNVPKPQGMPPVQPMQGQMPPASNAPKPQGMPPVQPVQPMQGQMPPVQPMQPMPNAPKPQGMPSVQPVQPMQGQMPPAQPVQPMQGQMPPAPKPQGMPPVQPVQPMPQGMPPVQPMSAMPNGGFVGQMGSKPIPHMVRKKTGETINITKPEFSIGKSKTKADYSIEDNPAISRVHCIIVQRDGVNYIKDNNSTNHTYLNGVELAPGKEHLLKNKTLIQMGDEEFTFLLRKGE